MCYEFKPHVKQWLMLTNPVLAKDFNKFLSKSSLRCSTDDPEILLGDNSPSIVQYGSINQKFQEVPILLRDPIALMLLIVSNMPSNFEKGKLQIKFFNLIYINKMIDGFIRKYSYY